MKFDIGTKVDLDLLMDGRLLIQGQSGSGKSYLLRKILEETHGKVPHLIIDRDGEYYTLKEKHDYVLIGRGSEGEIPINMKYIETMCHELLRNNINAILDLSEQKPRERMRFVKEFSEALLDSPKEIRHPVIYAIDEAHLFAPEIGRRRGNKAIEDDSTEAVIDICSNGRKRGICTILITQRISKLANDAISEMDNRIYGRTIFDLDVERVGKELGMKRADANVLKQLKDGQFYAFGRAIGTDVVEFQASRAKTTHPKISKSKWKAVPKASNKVKSDLLKLVDIPEEAEKELKTKDDLKKRIKELEVQVKSAGKVDPGAIQTIKSEANTKINAANKNMSSLQADNRKLVATVEKLTNENNQRAEQINKLVEDLKTSNDSAKKLKTLVMKFQRVFSQIGKLLDQLEKEGVEIEIPEIKIPKVRIDRTKVTNIKTDEVVKSETKKVSLIEDNSISVPPQEHRKMHSISTEVSGDVSLQPAYAKLLNTIAMFYPESVTPQKLSFMSGVQRKVSTFRNGISRLRSLGYIQDSAGGYVTTEAGYEAAGDVEPLPTDMADLRAMWRSNLQPAYQKLFDAVVEAYPHAITKEEIAEQSGIDQSVSTFRNGLSRLNSLELVVVNKNEVTASKELFE